MWNDTQTTYQAFLFDAYDAGTAGTAKACRAHGRPVMGAGLFTSEYPGGAANLNAFTIKQETIGTTNTFPNICVLLQNSS